MKKVLSIAGSDCSGGAGIQADLKTFSAHGVFGMSVIVSVVAENTFRVISIQNIDPRVITEQIDAVFEDIGADAVKIGMLSTPEAMCAVAEKIDEYRPKGLVVDPVMYAKNGAPLMEPRAVSALIERIIPRADILTPNIPEAEKIAGIRIDDLESMKRGAAAIQKMGSRSVLLKGGHLSGRAVDVLYDGDNFYEYDAPRIDTKNTHGTGCTYSSAIASNLALGYSLPESVHLAKEYVTTAIRHAMGIGRGNGPTNHFHDLYENGLRGRAKNEN